MKKEISVSIFIGVIILSLISNKVYSLDYPHAPINSIACDSCHYVYADEPLHLPPWTNHSPQDIDDTQFNTLCWSCHNDITAPYVKTHSSLQIDNSYGDWVVECRVCHNPHYQKQVGVYGSPSYLFSGISTTIQINQPQAGQSQLTMTGAGWTDNQFQGLVLIPNENGNRKKFGYKILSNTADTITVKKNIDLTLVTPGVDTFAVIYGKLINSTIILDKIINPTPPKTGTKAVSFFNATGTNSFADGDATYDGVCEVCHTETTHFRNNGNGSDQLHSNMNFPAGTNCTVCHKHKNGFRGMGGGAHETHVTKATGPQLQCADCHGVNLPPLLGDNQNTANTTVCNNCHSLDGAAMAKTYFTSIPDTWVTNEGQASFCGGCHDESPGNSRADGLGNNATNIVGDNATYGFFVTGHGKNSGTYTRMSWQDVAATGNPAANKSCTDCHDLSINHFNSGNKRLNAGYENDVNNSNCKQCHEPGTVATASPKWYTTYAEFQTSAHSTKKCSDCHNVHGSSGNNPAMTKGNQESLCYQCHKDPAAGGIQNDALANNRTGGYVSADDIQEAFSKSEKHDLGTTFSIGSGNYSLECISCHNVHIVTGKYWDAKSGKSPVTRFTDNLEVWGDESGEKMDDFASQGAGTGGWYYKTAQGYPLGTGSLVYDVGGVYQPPKQGNGYDFEFGGDVLPDYASFCLDCHSNRVSAANPPVNWGQGIGCTGNGVDPPDQRIECGAMHGLSVAGKPSYISDAGTAGFWGNSGNPDMIFQMNYVTRGRNNGHFMRWPYDSANRSAGINFVLSCTDCHEAHGANRGSMIRERFNVNGNGDCGAGGDTDPNGENCADGSNWNQFCNVCHYYYGGHHAGMSCGNASCHETNSIHRIIHAGSGGGTQLMVTSAGYESDFVKPDFTPEMGSVTSDIASNTLTVTFDSGVWSNIDLTGVLDPDDFWLFDKNGDNPRTITNVIHTSGDSVATLVMSAPNNQADLYTDTLAMKPASVWNWYDGGYVNWATGVIGAQAVSGGPWPVTINGPSRIAINKVEGLAGYDELYVEFSEAAYANSNSTGDLQLSDFIFVDTDDGRNITTVVHVAGDHSAVLKLDSALDVSSDIGVDHVAAFNSSVFGISGIPASTNPITVTAMPSPIISSLEGVVGSDKLMLTFSSGVYSDKGMSGDLQPLDLNLTDTDNGRTITAVSHSAGELTAILTLSSVMDGTDDFLIDSVAVVGGAVFDANDYPATTTPVLITAQAPITIVAVTGQVGYDKLEVRFSGAVYADVGATGSLQPGDFVLTDTDNGRTITAVTHSPGVEKISIGEDIAVLTLSSPLDSIDDLNIDTLAAIGIYNFMDIVVDETPVTITIMPAAVITSLEGAVGSTKLKVMFSHWVYGEPGTVGTIVPSDFVLNDIGGDNPRTIWSVQHGAGDAYAIVTMSSPLAAGDVDNDTIAAVTATIFNSADHPVGTTAVAISAQPAPTITSVEGTVNMDQILVLFSEGVYADTGQSGMLMAADFSLIDTDNSRTITAVAHTAGTASALLTLSSAIDASADIGTDTVAANGIYNKVDNAVDITPVTLSGNNCPVTGTRFDFSEGIGSSTVTDDTGLLSGTVVVPAVSIIGDGLFTGDETEANATAIDVKSAGADLCLKTPRVVTLESRFFMTDADLDYVDVSPANGIDDDYDVGIVEGNINSTNGDGRNATFHRLAERQNSFLFTIMRASYAGDFIEARQEKARVEFKYITSNVGTCDGTFPNDPTGEGTPVNGSAQKQISSDIDNYPIVTGHWYKIKIVFNTDKTRNPVDIFGDDQGTDGSGAGELWAGYKNIAKPDPEDSAGCKWAAIPGIEMKTLDRYLFIGDNCCHTDVPGAANNGIFKGKIDWFSWKPIVDYSDVDDLPHQ